jgi:hypothetical protein
MGQSQVGRMMGNAEPWAWCFLAVMLVVNTGVTLEEARAIVDRVRYPEESRRCRS